MSRLRVLLVDHAPVFGGAEAALCDLAATVDQSRFEPILVTDPSSPALDRFRRSGASVRTVRLARLTGRPMPGYEAARSALALARLAREEQAVLVHTATARTHIAGAMAARLTGLPVVWQLHDDTLPMLVARLLGSIPRRILPVSAFLAGRYHSLRAPMTVVYNGVRLPPRTSNVHSRQVTLAGRLVRWKGQTVFIHAMADVMRRLPDAQAEIVGTASAADNRPGQLAGGEAYRRELIALVDSLELAAAIDFPGFREPASLYADSALAVHASILPEAFGRTVVEAMAAGVAVIGARAGAIPEVIVNGVTGRLVPVGDAEALADAIVSLMSDPERRRAMGQAGRQRAAEHFSVDQMARKVESAWLEAAG